MLSSSALITRKAEKLLKEQWTFGRGKKRTLSAGAQAVQAPQNICVYSLHYIHGDDSLGVFSKTIK